MKRKIFPSRFIYKTGRFPAPLGFKLSPRPTKSAVQMDMNPDDYTVEQLLVQATMKRYELTQATVATILGISEDLVSRYLAFPGSSRFRQMSPTVPNLLEAWCRQNRATLKNA